MSKRVCVDFDGVIHKYSKGYQDGSIYDEPMEGTKKALETLRKEGFEVIIFTTRTYEEIKDWLATHEIPYDQVTQTKIPALVYIDDRGLRFTNWKDILNYFR
jgi:hydroxymethylpyrimidine pyrophosphatase-like HAD family hydrolase